MTSPILKHLVAPLASPFHLFASHNSRLCLVVFLVFFFRDLFFFNRSGIFSIHIHSERKGFPSLVIPIIKVELLIGLSLNASIDVSPYSEKKKRYLHEFLVLAHSTLLIFKSKTEKNSFHVLNLLTWNCPNTIIHRPIVPLR